MAEVVTCDEQWTVTKEEWYPVFCRDDDLKADGDYTRQVTLTAGDAAFVTRVFADMEKAQEILQAAYDAAHDVGTGQP